MSVSQRRGKEVFLFKQVWMVFCASAAQAQSRSVYCFNHASGWTTMKKKKLLQKKPLLARSSLLSQPAPPQCDSSSQRSPAIGTGSDAPGILRGERQSTEREGSFLFKQVWMVFCASAAQFQSRSVYCFNHASGWTAMKKKKLLQKKPLLARSSRDRRRSGSSKG